MNTSKKLALPENASDLIKRRDRMVEIVAEIITLYEELDTGMNQFNGYARSLLDFSHAR